MEFEYSPRHHSPSSAAHLLSPTHHHSTIDSIRQLRRTLSRSPSKPARFQLYTTRSSNTSPTGNHSPSSPSGLSRGITVETATEPVPRPRFSVKRSGTRPSFRRTSPNSPLRRALSDKANHPNVRPGLIRRTSAETDQENMDLGEDKPKKPESRFDDPIKLDFNKPRTEGFLQPVLKEHAAPKTSPLKRSDGVMNLEVASMGSPRVKRRSLHGASSLGSDFNVFDQSSDSTSGESTDAPQEKEKDKDAGSGYSTWPNAGTQSPHRRPFHLRKSTLQQRNGPGRARLFADAVNDAPLNPALTRARSRISLDGALPLRSQDFDSPFRRSSANEPPVLFPPPSQKLYQSAPKPHPLSHALTPSSSNSSITDEPVQHQQPLPAPLPAPTFVRPEPPKPMPSFTKSLPIGAMRPAERSHGGAQGSFSTPDAFRMAKPLPQAFLSTGLISKRNRSIDLPGASFGAGPMPDTPSKKAHTIFTGTPAPASGLGKVAQPLHEFGSPTSPFNGRVSKMSPESFGKGANIFGSHAPQLTRRGSFVSLNGDDIIDSPTRHLDCQMSGDELPPTPTKANTAMPRPQSKGGKSNSLRSSLFGRRTSMSVDTFVAPPTDEPISALDTDGKYISPLYASTHADLEMSDEVNTSTKPAITLNGSHSPSPCPGRRRQMRQSLPAVDSPPMIKRGSHRHYSDAETFPVLGEMGAVPESTTPRRSPQTPHDSNSPPDASKLSISAGHRSSVLFPSNTFPPATPTGPRESYHASMGQSNTSSGYFANDVDTSLTARFGQVASFGIGEFSQVYRVEKPVRGHSTSGHRHSGHLHRVWAVKKSRKPYTGNKDRARKMREVQILKQLRGEEHVIELVDEWESKNHLYIQTEFCENGNLKDFLAQAGFKGRLDDFRIWKILLELAQGVKSIHDANVIHLDLKPANVFIDWEGVLKIGDFGMASDWPAPHGLDGEGDREYIGPEVLCGRFDKPADIFALGMIMLEIAGNIVLPDNGVSWQRLRHGDMSDLPSLTWSSDSSLLRNESGDPVEIMGGNSASRDSLLASDSDDDDLAFLRKPTSTPKTTSSHDLVQPPNFMVDSMDPGSLDQIVQWMIRPDPDTRPTIDQLLATPGVQWVQQRRRAGATVYEGNWGAEDEVLGEGQDVEMMDI